VVALSRYHNALDRHGEDVIPEIGAIRLGGPAITFDRHDWLIASLSEPLRDATCTGEEVGNNEVGRFEVS
jgi:hypothetical protein